MWSQLRGKGSALCREDASATEAGALREEQLEDSEQLANHSQAIHVVTDFCSRAGREGWVACPQQRETSVGSYDVKTF